jgi:hypothetical protein
MKILNQSIMKKIMWDYNITEDDFLDYLYGKKTDGWFNQEWALLKAIERLNYYEFIEIVPLELLQKYWKKIKPRIWREEIKDGIEFLLQRYSVSTAR